MSAKVVLQLGSVRSGKTHEMLRRYRDALRRSGTAPSAAGYRALWLAPTSRNAALVREGLLDDSLRACLAPGIMTFDQLVDLVLAGQAAAATGTPRLIRASMSRELLRRIIDAARERGQLTHFQLAASRSGFVDLVADHIRELKRRGIDPASYARAAAHGLRTAEHHELALLYAEYDRQLSLHQLTDVESRPTAARNMLAAGGCPKLQHLELVVVDGFADFTHTQHQLLVALAQRTSELYITLPCDPSGTGGRVNPPQAPGSAGGRTRDNATRHVTPPAEPGAVDPDLLSPLFVGRPDLFAKAAATAAELKHFHRNLELRQFPLRSIAWPALDHLARHLFRNPRQIPPLSPAAESALDRLKIIEAAGPHDEIVQLARHIKDRLSTGAARPGEIVVAFRSLADAAPRVREVFPDFGIPYSLESSLPLATVPLLRTLLALLRLKEEDWPFRRVVSVLTNNTLTAIDDDARRAADWLVRDLQVPQSRDKLLARVAQLAAEDQPAAELTERAERRLTAAKAALPALQLLASVLEELPESALPTAWPAALSRLGQQLGLSPLVGRRTDNPVRGTLDSPDGQDFPSHDMSDEVGWHSVLTHFAALERLNTSLGEPQRPLSCRELRHWLVDLADHESLPRPHDDAGRVRVLSAATARTIPTRHLYLAGLSEQAFPSPQRAGRLATDADYRFLAGVADQTLAADALPAPSRAQGEMLLFYEVIARAEESLTISYPALDDRAQQLPPSPYVTEILRTLGDGAPVSRSLPHLSPIPPSGTPPRNVADWRVQAIAQAVGKDRNVLLLAGIFQTDRSKPLAAAIEAGLRITEARQRRDTFDWADGMLASPAVAARLADRFGPTHLWSVSQWEKYAACPYKFYLEDVLHLEPLGDLTLQTDLTRRGSLLHRVLAQFHRQWRAQHPSATPLTAEEHARRRDHLTQVLAAEFSATPHGSVDDALVELDRREIAKWLERYVDRLADYEAGWSGFDSPLTPTLFELRFGPPRPGETDGVDERSVSEPMPLDIGGETVLVTGRIDRIDVGRVGDRTVFNVIDYKSGKKPGLKDDQILAGERLQLPLYCVAAQVLVFKNDDAAPLAAGYWTMAAGYDRKNALQVHQSVDGALQATERWKSIQPQIVKKIGQVIRGIRQGQFPVFNRDEKCTSRCEFHTICRIAQVRSLNKTWPIEVEGQESRVKSQNPP